MKPVVKLYKFGRMSYFKTLIAQQVLSENLRRNLSRGSDFRGQAMDELAGSTRYDLSSPTGRSITNSLILVEHEPVYTIGLRTKDYKDDYLVSLRATLEQHKLKADFFKTNRGGLITFHGPGQLVAYPILYLGDFAEAVQRKSIKSYVNILETTIIDTLNRAGLTGAHTVREYPGVWLGNGERKIAFIGISCKRYVTMHGLSINCDCELTWFDHIISCGLQDKKITSIRQELQPTVQKNCYSTVQGMANRIGCNKSSVEHVANQFCLSFSDRFCCSLLQEEFPWESVQCSVAEKKDKLNEN